MSDASKPSTRLADFVLRTFQRFKKNRSSLEDKWRSNYAAFYQDPLRAPKGPWKKSEEDAEWMSDNMSDTTRQKVLTAHGVVRDAATKGNRLAFMLKLDQAAAGSIDLSSLPQAGGAEADAGAGPVDASGQLDAALKTEEDIIQDQLDRCDAVEQVDICIQSALTYGRGWLKRFVHDVPQLVHVPAQNGGFELHESITEMPGVEWKSVWNIYTDLEDSNTRTNAGVIEHCKVDAYFLRKRIKERYYDAAAIKRVIKTCGTTKQGNSSHDEDSEAPGNVALSERIKNIPYYEFWGRAPHRYLAEYIKRRKAEAGGASTDETTQDETELSKAEDDGHDVECHVIVAGAEIIRFVLTDPRDRPYYLVDMELAMDTIAPRGIADAVQSLERTCTGLIRAIENNAKLTSNFTVAGKRRFIKGDVNKLNRPGKFIDIDEDAPSVEAALKQLVWDDITAPLKDTLTFFLQLIDRSSMQPLVQQGHQEAEPQTAYELQQRLENAGKYLASVITHLDRMIEDVIRDVYIWNVQNDPRFARVPAMVKALAFTSFENRVIRATRLMQLLGFVLQHEDLKRLVKLRWVLQEIVIAYDVAPEQFLKTITELRAEIEREEALARAQANPANGPVNQLAQQKLLAEIEKLRAEIADVAARTDKTQTESMIRRAEAARNLGGGAEPAPAVVEPELATTEA